MVTDGRTRAMTSMDPPPSDSEGYDPITETYHAYHDRTTAPVGATIVETVATITGKEPSDVDPLHEVVDPDALDAIFEPTNDTGVTRTDGTVSFVFEGYDVTVRASGEIIVDVSGEEIEVER